MKIRKGFVSNSSSSSFICDLTSDIVSGMDYCLTDCEMVECVNDHTFYYDGYPEVEAWVASSDDEDDLEDDSAEDTDECGGYVRNVESNYNMPARICPICNGKAKDKLVKRMKAELRRLNLTAEDMA